MNRVLSIVKTCVIAMLAGGCASKGDVPLIFVQSNTAGIEIGTAAATQGADFVLGYKGSDFAIVPVTVVQGDGSIEQIEASITHNGENHSDALSVFGQFDIKSNNNAKSPKSGLGRFFATGQAAKRLSDGYAAKLGKGKAMPGTNNLDCFGKPAVLAAKAPASTTAPGSAAPSSAPAPTTAGSSTSTSTTTAAGSPAAASASATASPDESKEKKAKSRSLVFAEHVNFGLVLTGSATEGAGGLTLGYKDQDVAVIPAISRHQDGNATLLLGETAGNFDALSVLGQFGAEVKGDAGQVDVDLGKFFVTGLAAKNLADGFAHKLCSEFAAPAQ